MSEEAFWAALDAAVPGWRGRRDYPYVFAGFQCGGGGGPRERVEDVVASTLGRNLHTTRRWWDLRRPSWRPELGEVLDRGHELDRVHARSLLESALCTTPAYGEEWVEAKRARHVADTFVGCFEPEATFWTNYPQLTSASLETGVVAVDTASAGILWVIDED